MKSPAHYLSLLNQSIVYQIFTGRWESANIIDHKQNVFNKLKTFSYEHLSDMGIDTIYLLGVFDNRGPIIVESEEGVDLSSVQNRYPSPFAISDHKSTNPDLGSTKDLRDLIALLHKKKFKVILDFVPNHTSTVHPWTKTNPDYYVANESFVREFSGDVFKLNYQNLSLQKEMISILETIANWGVDGVRCDMAHLVPLDFWSEAIKKIKSLNPSFAFIAEAYSDSIFSLKAIEDHVAAGFDAVYHQPLFENLKKVYQQGHPKEYLESHIKYIKKRDDINQKLLSYISNHDDPVPSGISNENITVLLQRIINLPGPTLIYNGVTKGFKKRLAHHYLDFLSDEHNEVLSAANTLRKNQQVNLSNQNIYLGIDIGGTKIASAIVDHHGNIKEKNRENIPVEKESEQIIDSIIKQVNIYMSKGYEIKRVGISVPGFIDELGGVLFAGGTLKSLIGINIPNSIKNKIGKNIEIAVENDANCFALAEAIFGAGKSEKVVIGVIWGSGVGSGIVVNKKIVSGEIGGAGELGHIVVDPNTKSEEVCGCGQKGCLEMLASGKSIERRYKQLGGIIQDATVKEIYESDEEIAKKVISDAIYYLGLGISYLVNIINPGVIVLGGGVSLLPDEAYERIRVEVGKHALKTLAKDLKIVRHQISDDAGIVGAASLVIK